MSVLAAKANGNWTAAGTWELVDSTSYLNSELNNTLLTASLVASSAFTPGAITIDGIGVKVAAVTNGAGTVTVDLFNQTDGVQVAGTSTSVNVSDLPVIPSALTAEGGWFFFKFSAPVTLIAGKAYQVRATAASNLVNLFRDGTANNWSRYLRTTTTQAPAAGDDTIITGEWTAAATMTARAVTMNETATTAYGANAASSVTPSLSICKGATLTFDNTINSYLRIKGYVVGYNGGALNNGGVGTEIPRNKTAVFEIQCTVDGDGAWQWRNGFTLNGNGLSRTVGKNVVNTMLTADVTNANLALSSSAIALTNTTRGANARAVLFSTSAMAASATDNATNNVHVQAWPNQPSVTNLTQSLAVYLERGTGTNNRFVRFALFNSVIPSQGFYADVDLQAGTIAGAALGTGSYTSGTITAVGNGYLITITGKGSTSAVVFQPMLFACNALGTVSYAGDATVNFYYYGMSLYTAAAVPTTTGLTVADDTGWLSGDVIALASTSQTPQDCEPQALNGNAGASSITLANNLLYAHSGTSPTQAEVILLTRNVVFRGASLSAVPFMFFGNTANVTLNWVEFYNLGLNVANQRALDVQTTTGSFTANYCSIHDTKNNGISLSGAAINNIAVTYAMMFNINTSGVAVSAITVPATTGTVLSFDHCIVMPINVVTAGITISDFGTSLTNCTVCGVVTNNGVFIGEPNVQTATYSNITIHSNTGRGLQTANSGPLVLSNIASWRNGVSGWLWNGGNSYVQLNTGTFFGNLNSSFNVTGANGVVELNDVVAGGDTTFSTAAGVSLAADCVVAELRMNRCNFGTVSGIKTAHATGDIVSTTAALGSSFLRAILNNTTLASANQVVNQTGLATGSFIAAERLNGTAGNHKTWKPNGTISLDAAIFGAATPSERLTPLSASAKLESGGKIVPVASGSTPTVTAKVRKSVVGDGAAYNGNQPRLVVKANPSLGLNVDTVLATAAGAAGSSETLTATLPAPTDDGAFQVVVDCDGTTGWVNDDDWAAAA